MRGGSSLGAAVAAFALIGGAAAILIGPAPAGAQAGRDGDPGAATPPQLERAEPVDPMELIRDLDSRFQPVEPRKERKFKSFEESSERPVEESPADAAADQEGAPPSEAAAPEGERDEAAAPPEGRPGGDIERLERSLLEGGAAPLREYEPAPPVPGVKVVLRGLDKMTGDLGETEASIGETAKLWRLEIDVKACYSRVEASKSAAGSAFLQIRDTKKEPAETVFSGWMFAASPALSAMDHPRYDVWVLSCSTS